ncbi:putative L,D-transpeptidase 2, YkuD familiy [Gottschalkia acidurici 9a]|uniref:L,D-transpeptidase 2, YkuD familiy n=1 Tax=Gottschalkia acidurici (strain ATCC 7906 / DSM 604 / BCRC 14475 / CIP 104303 / KCTC 5404 / NCIMB 10678 / 9a) TaxID=1128398 RepID=K0B3U1_GOTA9|nr:L,D-transpeptidase [Gottschalkia acidurici]AFS79565.1 putative L,D-transpeptidase 2, YkuD familiy [Gottschalkia acidurici 9a]
MNNLKKRISVTLATCLAFLIFNDSKLYASEESSNSGHVSVDQQVPAGELPLDTLKASNEEVEPQENFVQPLKPNEFNVNFIENGFYFNIAEKKVTVYDSSTTVSAESEGTVSKYYFYEKFILLGDKVSLSTHQYNLLVNNIESEYAKKLSYVEPNNTLNDNEFNVNFVENGFNFDVNGKRVNVVYGNNIVSINSDNKTIDYYFSEKFMLEGNKVTLSNYQYNLLVNNIESSHARRIRIGTAIGRPETKNYTTIYSDTNLTQRLTTVNKGNSIRIINSVLDGKFKVLTPDGREGFADTRAIRILGDNIPPNISQFDLTTDYIVTISQDNQNLKVYLKNADGTYGLIKHSKASTGLVNTPTPNGIFTIKQYRAPWFYANSSRTSGAKHFVQFRGDHLIHSIVFNSPNSINQASITQLGSKASAGCVRIPLNDAKWFYDYVSGGSLLIIDNGEIDLSKIRANKNL